jgi:amino acid adenylation domain-containing protein
VLGLNLPWDQLPSRKPPTWSDIDIDLVGDVEPSLIRAAWLIVLARYSGQVEVPVHFGTNRVNWRVDDAETLTQVARRVIDQDLEASADVESAIAESGLAGMDWDGHVPAARITLVMTESSGVVLLRFDQHCLAQSTVQRFADAIAMLVVAGEHHRDVSAMRLPLLSIADRQWLDVSSIGSAVAPPTLAHLRFEQQAAKAPSAIAVTHGKVSLSYEQLNVVSNQLARWLIEQHVGAHTRVAVCLEPSTDIAVALLAIHKAGAVYVPIDPGYPVQRLAVLFEQIAPTVLITQSVVLGKMMESPPWQVAPIVFDVAHLEGLSGYRADNLDVDATQLAEQRDQPATIYFTSGTTGQPKGVVAAYHNIAFYVDASSSRYEFGTHDVLPALARFSFSISLFELLSPLVSGGTLVLLDRATVMDVQQLAVALQRVTIFHAGPSLLRRLLGHIESGGYDDAAYSKIRHASSGGDLIPPDVMEGCKRVFPQAELFVIYGCSEIACMGCTHRVLRQVPLSKTFVGKPFAGVVVRLIDRNGQQVPPGIVGEICFAGAGVGLGYWQRPELTDEKFAVLPAYNGVDGTIDSQRYYRTGDMGRRWPDGSIEILGRSDFQVKVRGMRIELGEVEFHLRQAPAVKDAVVMGHKDHTGDMRLIGYVVIDGAFSLQTLANVRRYMSHQVPDYMVPVQYVNLAALPLNFNLKVDRFALPAPIANSSARRIRYPRTPVERTFVEIWQQTLRQQQIGIDDNFFELGGDSLLAMNMMVELEKRLGVVIDGIEVLRESLEVLAQLCDKRGGHKIDSVVGADMNSTSIEDQLPLKDSATPILFGDTSQLYGALFEPDPQIAGTTAVLLCGPIGHELSRAHFVLTRTAKLLASQGIAALRMDYFGCGDSEGDARAASGARWQHDIRHAIAELRVRSGASRIVVLGVRLGAALAALAAPELLVVAWDPVLTGSQYLEELRLLDKAYRAGTSPTRRLRELAHELSSENVHATRLTNRDLRSIRVGAERIARAVLSADAGLDPGWMDAARVDEIVPDFQISSRLAAAVNELAMQPVSLMSAMRTDEPIQCSILRRPVQRVVEFGPANHLVGILTSPLQLSHTVVVMINAGMVPKFGPHRLYTELAQSLVKVGISSLRFDLTAMGDSGRNVHNLPVDARTAGDIAAAVDTALQRTGAKTLVLAGLCSGAEDALRYAMTDLRVNKVVALDAFYYPTTGWRWRNTAMRAARRSLRALGVYVPLGGQRIMRGGGTEQGEQAVEYEYMSQPEAAKTIATLNRRGVDLQFVYTGASGKFNYRGQMADMFPGLELSQDISVDYFADIEHTQLLEADRDAIVEAIVERFVGSGE